MEGVNQGRRRKPPPFIKEKHTGEPGLSGSWASLAGSSRVENLMRRAVRGRETRQVRPLSWNWTRHPPSRPRKLAETRPCLRALEAHKSDVQKTLRICFSVSRGSKQF